MAESLRNDPVALTVNGSLHKLAIDSSRSLLDVLRDDLNLTGAKKSCDTGECGSCMVLLGKKSVMACLLAVSRAQGKEIITIEGLAPLYLKQPKPEASLSEHLHPLQETFIELGASQCGFCIPGIIMEAYALLTGNPNPTRDDIVKRLSRNICRCTGYIKIIDAILYASELMRGGQKRPRRTSTDGHVFGDSVVSLDALDEVTGKAKYAADLKMEGMLYAKLLRSSHHHARILSIDTSQAETIPGVEAIVTARDVTGPTVMLNSRPQHTIFAQDVVRFKGEAIAAVAAVSEEVAAQAVDKIRVEYEPLTPVLDPLQAMKDDSPQLYPPYNNWILAGGVDKGDVDRGFAEADVIVENTYTTEPWEHAAMEPEAALAYLDHEGHLTIHSPQHHPFVGRDWIAELLGLGYDQVRIICPSMGGNFGMRGDFLHSGTAALLAYKTKKPVKIVYSREESLLGSSKSHSYVLRYKTGATKDGKLVAMEATIIGDGGCWIPHPEVTDKKSTLTGQTGGIASLATGPYDVPNVRIKVYEVCTNRPRSIPMRGTNMPQLAFAWDSQMDLLAQKLEMDPFELRTRNAMDVGHYMASGELLDESVGTRLTLEALQQPYREALGRVKTAPPAHPWKRGIGLAAVWQVNGGGRGEDAGGGWHGRKLGPARAAVELTEDGKVRVLVGVVEKGQGVITGLAQIAAEELGLPLSSVVMIYGDTLLAPYPVGTSGQRTSMHVGGAISKACKGLKEAVFQTAAEILEERPEDISFQNGYTFSSRMPDERLSLRTLVSRMLEQGTPLKYEGTFTLEKTEAAQGPIYGYASQLSEVDVNIETGQIVVNSIVYAADVGRVINPLSFEGQVEGGVVMGMSYALKEHFVPGETRTLKEYGLPTIRDAPVSVRTIIVGIPFSGGPFGSKGGAEMPASPGPASIANAIKNATGARIYDLPITPDRVVQALNNHH